MLFSLQTINFLDVWNKNNPGCSFELNSFTPEEQDLFFTLTVTQEHNELGSVAEINITRDQVHFVCICIQEIPIQNIMVSNTV